MVLAVGGDGLGGWGVDGVLGHVFWVGWADHQTLIQHPWHAAALGVMCFWNVVGLGGLVRAWGWVSVGLWVMGMVVGWGVGVRGALQAPKARQVPTHQPSLQSQHLALQVPGSVAGLALEL